MNIPFADLSHMHREISSSLVDSFSDLLSKNLYINGDSCHLFEKEFAKYCNAKHAVGTANGLDALHLLLKSYGIGPGDEVIVPAHTFIATALAVQYCGARPIYVDIEKDFFGLDPEKIEDAITPSTKAVIMVHLYGQIGYFKEIKRLVNEHNLFLFEDSAQSHGATYFGQKSGSLADGSGFSFYPGKNLGALGDGGAVTTNSQEICENVRMLGNYGSREKYVHEIVGINSRLDELQAAFLRIKLQHVDRWTNERIRIANRYLNEISNPLIKLPTVDVDRKHVYHIFPILVENRSRLVDYLEKNGIRTLVHYPYPMHKHKASLSDRWKNCNFPIAELVCKQEVSIPIYYGMTDEQIDLVINTLNRYDQK